MKYLVLVGDPKADDGEGEMHTFEVRDEAIIKYWNTPDSRIYGELDGFFWKWVRHQKTKPLNPKYEPSPGHFQRGY